jgi:hypothetical protein
MQAAWLVYAGKINTSPKEDIMEATQTHTTIEINASDYPYDAQTITLTEVRRLGNIPTTHRVFIEIPEPTDDPEFVDGHPVRVHEHRKFYSVSPAVSGGAA